MPLLAIHILPLLISLALSEQECLAPNVEEIDLNKFMNGNKTVKDEIATRFDSAMMNLGFLYLTNHGANINKINALYNATKNFFRSPTTIKQDYIIKNEFGAMGYHPYGTERQDRSYGIGPDLVEMYYLCNIGYNFYLSDPAWSEIPIAFFVESTNIMQEYVYELRLLLYRLHVLATYALDMDTNYFEQFMIDNNDKEDIPNMCLRLNYYFNLNADEREFEINASRLGKHSDYRSFTLLYIDKVEGLQVEIEDNKWFEIVGKKDSFIVNAGDFIELWTFGRWKAAKHRVLPTSEKERISMTFFTGPRNNVIIEPFPECKKCRKSAKQHSIQKFQKAQYNQ